MIWVAFMLLAGGLVYAGSRLTVYADQIADEFGFTRSWVGLLAVALVTSLPEIATTLSSITKVEAPDMALGNVFGSCLFNLFILAICDFAFRKGGLLKFADRKNVVSAHFDILILVLALVALVFPFITVTAGPLNFGWGAPVVIVVGIVAFGVTYRVEHRGGQLRKEEPDLSHGPPIPHALSKFLLASLAVVLCGYALAVTGDKIAAQTTMTHTFVGTLFLALATSLPELIVSITAIRIGAYDLMVGNILGSNLWNVMIYGLSDVVYTKDVLEVPENLGWGQVLTGVVAIAATCVVIVVLLRRRPDEMPKRRFGWESYVIAALYLFCVVALYLGAGKL